MTTPGSSSKVWKSTNELLELKLGRELNKPISYSGLQKAKYDLMVEQAVNFAISGNFKALSMVMKCKDLLNRARARARAGSSSKTCEGAKELLELKLANELNKQISYGDLRRAKYDLMLEQAVNLAIRGDFTALSMVMKCKELLSQAREAVKEIRQWTKAEIDKMNVFELQKAYQELIARSRPLSEYETD